MASSVSVWFSPNALARPNTHNRPTRTTRNKSHQSNPKINKTATSYSAPREAVLLPGGEATTYTRLPPKDDYFAPSFCTSDELKLAESTPINFNDQLQEEEDFNDNFDGNYETLAVFEGKGGAELDGGDENEDDQLFDEDNKFLSFEEVPVKEKGVPAVMRCFDRAKIYVKAGNGGNGVVAFRREKYVPLGGPSGGNGGRGGNMYIEVDGSMNSLLPFRKSMHFKARRGAHGQRRMMSGAKGDDAVVKVAPGTVIKEARKEEVLPEMVRPG